MFSLCLLGEFVANPARGTWCLFYGTWYTEYLAEEKDQRAVVATATVCLLLLHRYSD